MSESALPPGLPQGWDSTARADGLLLHENRRRERLGSLAFGVTGAVLWVGAAVWAIKSSFEVPVIGFCALGALITMYTAIKRWFTQPAVLVSPGRPLFGRVWVGNRSWVRPPAQVIAVQLTSKSAPDSGSIVTLGLVLTTHAVRPLFRLPDIYADDCRAFGQWLAATTGIRWTDGAGPPRNHRRWGGKNFSIGW